MKKLPFFIIILLILLITNRPTNALTEDDYYAIPPFIQLNTYANLYLVLDYSGSMAYQAYRNLTYNPTNTYFGYYDSNSNYKCNGSIDNRNYVPPGYNEGFANYIHCDGQWYKDSNGEYSGNELNFYNMSRIDILRFVLTGGGNYENESCINTNDCDIYSSKDECQSNSLCEWEQFFLFKWCENKKTCSYFSDESECNNNELCYWFSENSVITEYGEHIKYEDIANYNPDTGKSEGILQDIGKRNVRPRIGLVIYGSNVSYNIEPSYDYSEVIASINNRLASGGTYTYGGVNAAKEYYESGEAYNFEVNEIDTVVKCAKNFILLMSDGEWNEGTSNDSPSSVDPQKLIYDMWKGGNADITTNLGGKQNVETFSMAMFLNENSDGYKAMKHFAVYGGYIGGNIPCNYSEQYLDTSLTEPFPTSCSEWDKDNNGTPDNFFSGENPDEFKQNLENVFEAILKNVSSGTSVAVLSDQKKEGSIMAQAVFYPEYQGVPWIGKLFKYWYLNMRKVQNIREDTNKNFKLNICGGESSGDHILEFRYSNIQNSLFIDHYNSSCSGDNTTKAGTYNKLEDIKYLVEESEYLNTQFDSSDTSYGANVTYLGRKIYTNCDNDNLLDDLKVECSNFNFGTDLGCLINNSNLIDYVYGKDVGECQNRTDDSNTRRLLGDIIYSTPEIIDYDNVSILYIATNDGLLHAFRIGKTVTSNEINTAVVLQNKKDDTGNNLIGQEEWAFIPKNALPYLRHRAQPDFKHIYINDLTPYLYTTKTKKILIGGMRLGGGVGVSETGSVNPPSDTCSDSTSSSCVGRSSYYALDITDPFNPKFLWEFTDKNLGFTYSGPAVIKLKDSSNNDKYYVMFLSGMKDHKAELGYTGDNAKVYLLELRNDFTLNSTSSYTVGNIDSSMKNNIVFSNRLFTNGVDFEQNGYTDAVFFAFNYKQAGEWTANLYVMQIEQASDNPFTFNRVMASLHGAVSASVVYMPCFNMDYVYFGTGKWFYKEDDNLGGNNKLYGVNVTCLKQKKCNFSSAVSNSNVCDDLQNNDYNNKPVAWEVGLNTAETDNGIIYGKERIISDTGKMDWANTIIFTSTQPSADPCASGGRSRGWGLNCATGTSIQYSECSPFIVDLSDVTCAYMQTSTSSINRICKSSYSQQEGFRDVSNAASGGDSSVNTINAGQTEWFEGVTPETPPIIPPPYSEKKGQLLLWIEK
jgi:type IV pilus assembly protein PilY1